MLKNRFSPEIWVVLLLTVFISLWSWGSLQDWRSSTIPFKGLSTLCGVAGYFLFSLSLLLASRFKKLEDWIGGLDQIYHLHRRIGIWGFVLILVHPWIEALKWVPFRIDKFFLFTLPIHGSFSVNLGSYAYWLMNIILIVTLLKLLPYDKWKILHKFMSLVFVLASFHILLSHQRFGSALSHDLLWIPMAVGFWAILYKQLFVKSVRCQVVGLEKLNDNVIELIVKPHREPILFSPGQYGFFSFVNRNLTRESHPFTMIGTADDPSRFLILVKARGDFTETLFHHIHKGDLAWFEGPYGRFDYIHSAKPQIWIAGGIGIVPFIAWIREIKNMREPIGKVDLYYCTHKRNDAIFLEEFERFSQENSNFRCFLYCTEEANRLDIDKILQSSGGILEKEILMCGPIRLTSALKVQFRSHGAKEENIRFEDFEFF